MLYAADRASVVGAVVRRNCRSASEIYESRPLKSTSLCPHQQPVEVVIANLIPYEELEMTAAAKLAQAAASRMAGRMTAPVDDSAPHAHHH